MGATATPARIAPARDANRCFHAHLAARVAYGMSPRRTTVEHSKGVFEVEWPLFGELSRGLALKVAREYDPEIVVGIATAASCPAR